MPVGLKESSPSGSSSAPTVSPPMLGDAHLVVLAAKNGDPQARAVLATTIAHARTGAAPALAVAQAYDSAAKIAARAAYVRHWLYGDGAAKVARR